MSDSENNSDLESTSSNEEQEISSFTQGSLRFTQALQAFEEEINGTIDSLHHLQKKVHAAEHTHQDLYKVTGLRDILHQYIPFWKEEGRLSTSGSLVRLSPKEKKTLSLQAEGEWTSVYTVAVAMLEYALEK